jgi:hypothetical protein
MTKDIERITDISPESASGLSGVLISLDRDGEEYVVTAVHYTRNERGGAVIQGATDIHHFEVDEDADPEETNPETEAYAHITAYEAHLRTRVWS